MSQTPDQQAPAQAPAQTSDGSAASGQSAPGRSGPDQADAPSQASGADQSVQETMKQVRDAFMKLDNQVGRVIVGQKQVIEQMLIALFCRGHAVLVGVPGLAKTLLVSTIARALDLQFSRIQFTPDLMPSDITGTEVIEEDRSTGKRELRFVKGPVFANMILADEINRTPPKTQAALLESMQEHHVTVNGVQHALPQPFFVLATQNPIEQEGTYPLPEAQLDRFMFMVHVDYPNEDEELDIIHRTTTGREADVSPVLDADQVMDIQKLVRDVPVPDHVARYAIRLVRATRQPGNGQQDHRPQVLQQYVSWGAGPRATQSLVLAGKARAILQGRSHVTVADVSAIAHPVMRHRLICNFNAEADGVTTDVLIDRLLQAVQPDQADDDTRNQMASVIRS